MCLETTHKMPKKSEAKMKRRIKKMEENTRYLVDNNKRTSLLIKWISEKGEKR